MIVKNAGQRVVALCLLAALVACSGSADNSSTAGGPGADGGSGPVAVNHMSRDVLKQGGKFTWPIDQMPTNFNYGQLDGSLHHGFWILSALVPTAYTTDAAGMPVWNKDLLASEPVVVAEPKQIVTYNLNPKAAWYDGTPITWEDFHWQWKAQSGTDPRYQINNSNGYEKIESVERGKDDREVKVTFSQRFSEWQSLFNQIYPVSTNKDPKVFNEGWKEPINSGGPFRLGSIDHTAKTITLVRNEKFWGEPAILDTIVFRVISRDAQIDAVANGEVDGMEIGPDASVYARAKQIPGTVIRTAGGPNFRHITFSGLSPSLQDETVRQALAMGINRLELARAMLGPLGSEPKTLNNHIFMSNQSGHKENSHAIGSYNPEEARKLLAAAGWQMDGTTWKKDGKPLTVRIAIPSTVPVAKQEAEMIQNMLIQLGVAAEIAAIPTQDFFAKTVSPGSFDITLFSWMGTAYPISSAKSIYGRPKRGVDGKMNVQQNYGQIASERVDVLFDSASAELNREKAIELANRADSLIWHSVHSLVTYQRPEIIVVKQGIANFGAHGFAIPWRHADIGWIK